MISCRVAARRANADPPAAAQLDERRRHLARPALWTQTKSTSGASVAGSDGGFRSTVFTAVTIAPCIPSATGCVNSTQSPRSRRNPNPPRTRPWTAHPRYSRRSCRALPAFGAEAILGDDVADADSAPRLRTRPISLSTAGLSVERLITQFEMITSTDSRQRDLFDVALQEVDVRHLRFSCVLPRQREHLVRHVEAVGDAQSGRPAWPRGSRRCRRPSRGRARSRPRAGRRPRWDCRSRAMRAQRRREARSAASAS